MIRLVRVGLTFFSKITPEIVPSLKQRLRQTRQLQSLGQYFKSDNLEQLFEIVLATRMTQTEASKAIDSLFPFTSTENDHQINLLANLLKQKAIYNSRLGDLPTAISLLEQSLSTILLMESPNQLALSQIYKFIADLSIQINELKKAEQSLKEAENLLLNLEKEAQSEEQRYIDSGLACIYTQLCMIKYRDRRPMEALEELRKSLGYWDRVPQKILQEYELTCRLKCMIHLLFKENKEAVTSAKQFLTFMLESPQYRKATSDKPFIMTKLYFMNIVCMFEEGEAMEGEVVQLLKQYREEQGEEKLIQMMVMIGIKPDRYDV